MNNQDQFNDPVLDRERSGLWWYLKRPFVAAFYKSNEDVNGGDVLAAVVLYIAVSAVVIGALLLATVATMGVEATASGLAEEQPFSPANLLSSSLLLGMSAIILLPIIALLKLSLGVGGEHE